MGFISTNTLSVEGYEEIIRQAEELVFKSIAACINNMEDLLDEIYGVKLALYRQKEDLEEEISDVNNTIEGYREREEEVPYRYTDQLDECNRQCYTIEEKLDSLNLLCWNFESNISDPCATLARTRGELSQLSQMGRRFINRYKLCIDDLRRAERYYGFGGFANYLLGEIEIGDLSDEEKSIIKEETGWSDGIIDNIKNMKQYEILKNAGLKEVEINGRKCLIKENIDLDYKDADGISNRKHIARGLAPLDNRNGKPIELHHLGQKADSPLVELTIEEHRTGEFEDGKKNQSLWHDYSKKTEVHGEDNNWKNEREAYWIARSQQLIGGNH